VRDPDGTAADGHVVRADRPLRQADLDRRDRVVERRVNADDGGGESARDPDGACSDGDAARRDSEPDRPNDFPGVGIDFQQDPVV
jgi:hypothetical protein